MITRQTLDQRTQANSVAKAAVAAQEAAVRQAALDLEFTELRAPVSGRIGDRRVSPGNLVTGGTAGNTSLLATIQSTDPIRFEFTFDEGSYLHYLRLAKNGADIANNGTTVPVKLKLLDEPTFAHEGKMDFVDNAIDRSSGTIRGRAEFANPDGTFTPGMFGRVQVAAAPPSEVLLVPDAAIATEQVRKFVFVVDSENVARPKYVTLGPVVDGLRVIEDGLAPDDRVIVNGLMRARPGIKVAPQASSTAAAADAGRGRPTEPPEPAMRISHFFIDRPIFAAVVSIVFVIVGAVSFGRLPVAQYPDIAPPMVNVTGQYPGASADVVAATVVAPLEQQINGVENMLYISSNSTGDGRFTISVTFDLGTNLDIAQVQVQNRVAIAQPRLPVGRPQYRGHRRQELARPDDGRAPLFPGQVARHAVHLELCQRPGHRRAEPHLRRRLRHRVRRPRLFHAGLARSGPPAVAWL